MIVELTVAEAWRLVLFIVGGLAGASAAIALKHLTDPGSNEGLTTYDYWYYALAVSISLGSWLLGPAIGIDPFMIFVANTGVTTPLGLVKNVITWRKNGAT